MLYIVGTQKEAEKLQGILPKDIFAEVTRIAAILDENYGGERDVFEDDGGYFALWKRTVMLRS